MDDLRISSCERVYKEETIDWIENKWGQEVFVPVWGTKDTKLIKSYLLPKRDARRELETADFQRDGLVPGFTSLTLGDQTENVYSKFNNNEDIEPLVLERDFLDAYPDHVELVEEFRLLFNLYYDASNNRYMYPDNQDEVAKVEDKCFCVAMKFLKRYLAVKGMALILFVNDQEIFKGINEVWKNASFSNRREDSYYELSVGNCDSGNFSLLNGKKILYGCPIEECGIWPYEKKKSYVEFLIGLDGNGNEIKHTCDPDCLNNMSNIRPESPPYLTPVYFKKDVLSKYYNNPQLYEVEDGIIRCGGMWSLYIDNDTSHEEYISAYLGDLGHYLPSEEEQFYWRGFNYVTDGCLSITKIKRDFMAEFTNSSSPDFRFKTMYHRINENFQNVFGWTLFLPFKKEDEYNFNCLRVPTTNSYSQFDMLVLSLAKTLIDSLNEKAIKAELKEAGINCAEIKGSISLLEAWLNNYQVENTEQHISFLRNLYKLRSSGTGHRKGENYEKVIKKINVDCCDYKKSFANILEGSVTFLEFIDTFISIQSNDKHDNV